MSLVDNGVWDLLKVPGEEKCVSSTAPWLKGGQVEL